MNLCQSIVWTGEGSAVTQYPPSALTENSISQNALKVKTHDCKLVSARNQACFSTCMVGVGPPPARNPWWGLGISCLEPQETLAMPLQEITENIFTTKFQPVQVSLSLSLF